MCFWFSNCVLIPQAEEEEEAERQRQASDNLEALQAAEELDLVYSVTPTDCIICMDTYPPQAGVVLRNCGHSFCPWVLNITVNNISCAFISVKFNSSNY